MNVKLGEEGIAIAYILKHTGLTKGTSEAIRMIKQGAVKLNGEKIEDAKFIVNTRCDYIIQVGKRKFAKVTILPFN